MIENMNWSELERRPRQNKSGDTHQIQITTKKVAVRPDQIRQLPDGTTIVVMDKDKK